MKSICILIVNILLINFLNSQSMHTEQELKKFEEIVSQTRKLGRTAIIDIAVKRASNDPAPSLTNDENVLISVWYNNTEVKVEFRECSL